MKKPDVLFLTLSIFSLTGGIEKVCKIAGKVLHELGIENGERTKIFSLHDTQKNNGDKYFPPTIFTSFHSHKIWFVLKSIQQGLKSRVVILSHINLLIPGYFIKLFSPKTKLILFAHGIEVWAKPGFLEKKMIGKVDRILPVSNFTKEKMKINFQLSDEKFTIVNNCLDPFLVKQNCKEQIKILKKNYGFTDQNFILLTVARLSSKEMYKGYDKVIAALPEIIKQYPQVRYLVVGKYDHIEKKRLQDLIKGLSLEEYVIFTGYVPDDLLETHYTMADAYIMPSTNEGFGLSFIEAMFYGVPVVSGNIDGSVDALCNGKLGLMVNPSSPDEIVNAVKKIIGNKEACLPDKDLLLSKFNYSVYKEKLKKETVT